MGWIGWIGTKSRDGRLIGSPRFGQTWSQWRRKVVHVSGYVLKVELTLADGVGLGESLMTQVSDLYSISSVLDILSLRDLWSLIWRC